MYLFTQNPLSPQYRKCNELLNITEIVSPKQDEEVWVEI